MAHFSASMMIVLSSSTVRPPFRKMERNQNVYLRTISVSPIEPCIPPISPGAVGSGEQNVAWPWIKPRKAGISGGLKNGYNQSF